MVTKITDIAKEVGVAPSTVSNALTGKKYVSPELKERIMEVCKKLDYQPNFYASSLQNKKTYIIGLLLEQKDGQEYSPFYTKLIVSCLIEASLNGYNLLVFYESDETKFLNALRQGRAPIDGAVVLSPTLKDERIAKMESGRIPSVVIGHPDKDLSLSFVDVNNFQLTYDITKELIHKDYKKIYFINSNGKLTISIDRLQGFIAALSDEKLPYSDDLAIHSKKSTYDDGYNFAKSKMKKNIAFITANEVIAKGVCDAISDENLELGKDVGVFALGYSENDNFMPELSHAKQDYKEIGETAVKSLINLIENNEYKQNIYIGSQIIEKKSSKR